MSASSSHRSTPLGTPAPTPDARTTSHPAHKLLSRAHPDDIDTATKIFTEKIVNKPLLLSSSTDHADKRALRRHIRDRKKAYARNHARPKPLSAKEKRKLSLYDLKLEECSYEVYRGLNALWSRYILEVLGYVDREGRVVQGKVGQGVSGQAAGALIASADFHGMEVEIVRSNDAGRVGLRGIVVRETRSTVTLVCNEKETKQKRHKLSDGGTGREATLTDPKTQRDKVRMVLKKGSVLRVVIDLPSPGGQASGKIEEVGAKIGNDTHHHPHEPAEPLKTMRQLTFELHGDQLEIRPIERAVKKFKWKPMDYL